METLWVIINVLVLILLVGILYWMQRKHYSFTKRVFAGLGLGVLFGWHCSSSILRPPMWW